MTVSDSIERLKAYYNELKKELHEDELYFIRDAFILLAYKAGYPVNLIAHVAAVSEQTAYRIMRGNPVFYEQAKEARAKRRKEISGNRLDREGTN